MDQRLVGEVGWATIIRLGNASLLSDLCGRAYIGVSAKGKGGIYRYYDCTGRQKYGNKTCRNERLPSQRLQDAVENDRQKIHTFGRGAATAHRVHGLATRSVVIGASSSAKLLGLTGPPVYAAIQRLEKAGILREATGRQRGKLYVYDQYLKILNEGTKPF